MRFGAIIKAKRSALGLTLREASTLIGVDAAHLSRVERCISPPSDSLLERLSGVLKFPSDELFLLAGRLPQVLRDALEREPDMANVILSHLGFLNSIEQHSACDDAILSNHSKDNETARGLRINSGPQSIRHVSEEPRLFNELGALINSIPRENSDRQETYSEQKNIDPRNELNVLSSREWIPETVSVWTQRGLGAGHPDAQIERLHPAPFSFTDVGRLIRFFSKPGDTVLDPFLGIGSTLKACALEGRHGIGIELNAEYVSLSKKRLRTEVRGLAGVMVDQTILEGDSRLLLKEIPNSSIDFVVTSPPYWNILHKEDHKARQVRKDYNLDTRYSDDPRDLGNIRDYGAFISELSEILGECGRTLKPKKYMAVIVSDFRDKSRFVMFHADIATFLSRQMLGLRGIKILYQKHKKVFPYGYPFAYVPNIHHQYILILQNER